MSVDMLREFHALFPQLWQILEGRDTLGQPVPPLTGPLPAWDSGPRFSMTAAQACCAEIALTRGRIEID